MTEDHNIQEPPRAWRWGHLALFIAVGLAWLGLSFFNLWMGELNQDEGWYLYAAKQLAAGRLPYRDFAFTQAPLVPLAYAACLNWIDAHGILGGRILTWLFGTLGALAALFTAMRAGPRTAQRLAGGLCLILVALNVFQSYYTVVVKTYALASVLLGAGVLAISFVGTRRGGRAALLAGLLLAGATAVRISMGAALALAGLYLLLVRRRVRRWAWLDFTLGGAVGLAGFMLPFWLVGGEGFRFGVLEYHSLRDAGPLFTQLAYKAGCLSRLCQDYFPAAAGSLALLVAALLHAARRGAPAAESRPVQADPPVSDLPPGYTPFLWATALVLGLVHLAAPFPYDDYLVPVYPVFCAAFSATAVRWWLRTERRRFADASPTLRSARRLALLVFAALLCGLHAFSSPRLQDSFLAGRDRIWWNLREQSPVAQLRETAQWVRELTAGDSGTELLTQDTYLAVEANLPVPHGLEMGPFSYCPDWPRDKAARLGVVNRDMLCDLLASGTNAPIAALSGYSLSIRSPEVLPVTTEDALLFRSLLDEHFDLVETIPSFGQAATPLEIWRRTNPDLDEDSPKPAPPEEEEDEDEEPPSAEEDAPAPALPPLPDGGLSARRPANSSLVTRHS
ncbi:MAG: hypothetical protein IKQ55_10440 [Kiritimatiellae bacterium]|nr:hypothetical protein [Kiritimatiellia bacterium]